VIFKVIALCPAAIVDKALILGREEMMNKRLLIALFALLMAAWQTQLAQGQSKEESKKDTPAKGQDAAAAKDKADVHEFVITNFKTESGVTAMIS
jgi:hypothetical protein